MAETRSAQIAGGGGHWSEKRGCRVASLPHEIDAMIVAHDCPYKDGLFDLASTYPLPSVTSPLFAFLPFAPSGSSFQPGAAPLLPIYTSANTSTVLFNFYQQIPRTL
jgi:hypothetical protein